MAVPHELPGRQSRAASDRGSLDSANRLALDAWGVLPCYSRDDLPWIYEQDLGGVPGSSRDIHLPVLRQIGLIQYSSQRLRAPPRAGRLAVASTAPGQDRPRAGPSSQAVCEGWGPGAPGTPTAQGPGSHRAGPSSPVHPGSCAGPSVPSLLLLLGQAFRAARGHSSCLQDLLPQMVPLVGGLQPPSQPPLLPLLRLPRTMPPEGALPGPQQIGRASCRERVSSPV